MWRQRFERAHGARSGLWGDGTKVHLMLGVGGSSIDHLARIVSRPGLQLRFYNALLAKFEPKLILSKTGDRLAVPYQRTLDKYHPLSRIYRMLEESDKEWAGLNICNRPDTSDLSELPCLVKESHGLLATEALFKGLKAKALLYVGDPVKTVDRLLEQQGMHTSYLEVEGRSVLAPRFLSRYLRRDHVQVMKVHRIIRHATDGRKRTILNKVLVVALIQHMFRLLAARYPEQAILVEYERLEKQPELLEEFLTRLMGDKGATIARKALDASTIVLNGQMNLMWKYAWPESAPRYAVLTDKEVAQCRRTLSKVGLSSGAEDQEQQPTDSAFENTQGEFLQAGNG